MATYEIRPLQLRILDILLAVQEVCEQHNLRYFIIAGTLLGAVRHKGFIPWDDDLDIGMPRKDYEQLMANAKAWLPAQYEVVSYETDKTYPLPFAKIQDANTTLIERMHLKYLGGVYIDVFPIDGMTDNPLMQTWQLMRYFYYKKVLYFIYRDPYRHGHGPSSWLPLLCRKLYTLEGVQEKIKRVQKTYDYDAHNHVANYFDGRKGIMPRWVYGKPTPINFEDKQVLGVENTDAYLTRQYGDYMVPPPADKQRQHNFHLLDLNMPYRNYKEK